MNLDSVPYRHAAAEIAAAAVTELFPDVELLGGQETHIGFSYTFRFPHLIHGEMLAMIEQTMRQIVRERREIRVMEMVPFSASELLKDKGCARRAEELEKFEGQFVQVVQIGSFYDLNPGKQLKNSNQLIAFKLDQIERLEEGIVRLTGFAHPTKEELNEFIRRLKRYQKIRHEEVGEAQGLWKILMNSTGKEIIWLSLGLKRRKHLIEVFWQNLLGCEWIGASSGIDRLELLKQVKKHLAEILHPPQVPIDPHAGLYENKGVQIQIWTLDPSSLLQMIEKTLNILGLEYNDSFSVVDALGRSWPIVEVQKRKKGLMVLIRIEAILAILLEKGHTFENQ